MTEPQPEPDFTGITVDTDFREVGAVLEIEWRV
jgi:hypothetical protein